MSAEAKGHSYSARHFPEERKITKKGNHFRVIARLRLRSLELKQDRSKEENNMRRNTELRSKILLLGKTINDQIDYFVMLSLTRSRISLPGLK